MTNEFRIGQKVQVMGGSTVPPNHGTILGKLRSQGEVYRVGFTDGTSEDLPGTDLAAVDRFP